ncbi:hypothetical protein ACWGJ2_04270 [Streptomyces sp. NPDC054796]
MSDDNSAPGQQQGAPAGEGGQGPTGTAPKPTPPAAPPTGEGQQQGEDTAAQVARLESELAAARAEAGKSRITAKQKAADEARQELADKLLGILDPSKAGQQATPEELTQQLSTAQEQARSTAVELAVYRTAREAGGDPDALLDSRQFADAVAELDPTDTAAVRAAVEAAVAANPKLAAQPAGPPRGGAEFGGPPSQGVTAAQFAAMDYAQRAELFQSAPDTYRRLAAS